MAGPPPPLPPARPNPKRHEFAGSGRPWEAAVRAEWEKAGFNWDAIAHNIRRESGFRPDAVGDGGYSHGLYQFNFAGGVGTALERQYGRERALQIAKDPVLSSREMIKRALASGVHKHQDWREQAIAFMEKVERPAKRIQDQVRRELRGLPAPKPKPAKPVPPGGATALAQGAVSVAATAAAQPGAGGIAGLQGAFSELAAAVPPELQGPPHPKQIAQMLKPPPGTTKAAPPRTLRATGKTERPGNIGELRESERSLSGGLTRQVRSLSGGTRFETPRLTPPPVTDPGQGQRVAGRVYNPVTGDVIRPRNDTEMFLAVLGGAVTPAGQMVGERVQKDLRDLVQAGKLNPWPVFAADPTVAAAQHREAQVARKRLDALTKPVVDTYLKRVNSASLRRRLHGFAGAEQQALGPEALAAEKAQALQNLYHALKPQVLIPLYEQKYGKLSPLEKQVLLAELDQRALYATRTREMRNAYAFDVVVGVLADRFGARLAGVIAGRVKGRIASAIVTSPAGRGAIEGAAAGGPQQAVTRAYADPNATAADLALEYGVGTLGGGVGGAGIGGLLGTLGKRAVPRPPETAPAVTPELPPARPPVGSQPGGALRGRPRPAPAEPVTETVTPSVEAAPVAPRVMPETAKPEPAKPPEPEAKAPTFKEAGDAAEARIRARVAARRAAEQAQREAEAQAAPVAPEPTPTPPAPPPVAAAAPAKTAKPRTTKPKPEAVAVQVPPPEPVPVAPKAPRARKPAAPTDQAADASKKVPEAPAAAAPAQDPARQINNLKGEIAYLQLQATDPKTSPRDVPALQREIAEKKASLAELQAQAKPAAPKPEAPPTVKESLIVPPPEAPPVVKESLTTPPPEAPKAKAPRTKIGKAVQAAATRVYGEGQPVPAKEAKVFFRELSEAVDEAPADLIREAANQGLLPPHIANELLPPSHRLPLPQEPSIRIPAEEHADLLALGQRVYREDGITDPAAWRAAVREVDPDLDDTTLGDLWKAVTLGRTAPVRPDLGVSAVRNRDDLEGALRTHFGYSEADARTQTELFDARARTWAATTGKTPEDWYETFLQGVRSQEGGAGSGRAEVLFDRQNRALVTAFSDSNLSSAAHEFGHVYLHDLASLADAGLAKAKTDLAVFEKHAGLKDGEMPRLVQGYLADTLPPEDIVKYRQAQELWASGFERYLRDGKAPTPELKNVFSRFKAWLKALYENIKGTRLEKALSPEMREVFDNLFRTSAEAPPVKPPVKPPAKPPVAKAAAGPGPGEPSGQTGIANRLQVELVEAGLITRPKKALPIDPRQHVEWGYEQIKDAKETALWVFGQRVAQDEEFDFRVWSQSGLPPQEKIPWSPEVAAIAQGIAKRLDDERALLTRQLDTALKEGKHTEIADLGQKLEDLRGNTQQFLDNIQKGKGSWAHTGWVMQQAWNNETGNVEAMVRRARGVKGVELTPEERAAVEANANAYRETAEKLAVAEKPARRAPQNKEVTEEVVKAARPKTPKKASASPARPSLLSRVARALGLAQSSEPDLRPYTANLDDPVIGELAWDVLRHEGAKDVDDLVKQVQDIVAEQGGKVEYDDVVDELVAFRRREQKVRDEAELRRQNIMEEAREQVRLRTEPTAKERKGARDKAKVKAVPGPARPISQRTQELRDARQAAQTAARKAEAAAKATERLKADIAQLGKDLEAIQKGTYKAPEKPGPAARPPDQQALFEQKQALLKTKRQALAQTERAKKVVDIETKLRQRIADLRAKLAQGDYGTPRGEAQQAAVDQQIAALEEELKSLQLTRSLHRELASLETKLADPDYVPPTPKERLYTQEQEALRARLRVLRAQMQSRLQDLRQKGAGERAAEFLTAMKMLQLGSDAGVILRQGGNFLVTQPREYQIAFKRAVEAARGGPEVEARIAAASEQQVIRGKPLAQWERDAGLSLSQDRLGEGDEFIVSKLLYRVPGTKELERFQVTFLNELRREVFAAAVRSGMSPGELKLRASFINDLSGRANIPRQAQNVVGYGNIVATSLRYELSRWSLALYQPAKNAGHLAWDLARHGRVNRAAVENLRQAILGPVTALVGALTAAQAFGWEVEMDPTQTGFGNLRVGDTVYDLSAGVGPRVRDLERLAVIFSGPEFGRGGATELGKIATRALSPSVKGIVEIGSEQMQRARGESEIKSFWSGYTQEGERTGLWHLAPLIVGGAYEAITQGPPAQVVPSVAGEFLGAGVNRYPKPKVWDAPASSPEIKGRKAAEDFRERLRRSVTPTAPR